MRTSSWTAPLLALLINPAIAWLPAQAKPKAPYGNATSNATMHWLASTKIRGVNLGAMFIMEPWMASDEWSAMGCASQPSEFDCVSHLGQQQANIVFQAHWNTWITQEDLLRMQSYGLNTIRIPVGYWIMEELVYAGSEHFPQGGLGYLERLCGWASDLGFYIIIDLHGAPGAQVAQNADSGQYAPTPGFYQDYQYARAVSFLSWLTTLIHTSPPFRNVGMLSILNEPPSTAPSSLYTTYYPTAYAAIRAIESSLNIPHPFALHIQIMSPLWTPGISPIQSLPPSSPQIFNLAYDDHRYVKYDPTVPVTQSTYLADACHNDRGTPDGSGIPTIVGEFSLSVPDAVQWSAGWAPGSQRAFYREWWEALTGTWEGETAGWVFWAWKAQLGDLRWALEEAVAAGVVATPVGGGTEGVCEGY